MSFKGIYQITNLINNKIYIGSSKDICSRWKRHIAELNNNKHINGYLQRSWNKHGQDNFSFSILCILPDDYTKDQILEVEQMFLDDLDFSNSYNINIKATCPNSSLGVKRSQEFRDKLSRINLGKKYTQEQKDKLSKALKGISKKPFTTDHKTNLSLAHEGKTLSEEHKNAIQKTLLGKPHKKTSAKGITFEKNKWRVRITIECNKRINIGVYNSYEEALAARLEAESKYWN